MERTFKIGEHVCVADGPHEGKVGTIVGYGYSAQIYEVHLNEIGTFLFIEYDLIPQEEMNELDIEAEELCINKEEAKKIDNQFKSFMRDSLYKIMSSNVSSIKNAEIKKVIFNNPATIVFWSDEKKTVVKCADNETFDEEKGLAMAISKRVLGNHGNYYNEFKKWLPRIEVPCGRKNCDECDDLSLNKAMTGDARYECYSCRYLEVPLNKEPCEDCNYHNSKYKPKKGAKINGRYL